MPKTLTNRLEDLENEIQLLLTFQDNGDGKCKKIKGKSVTTKKDGQIEQIEFEGSNCVTAKSICSPRCTGPLSGSTNNNSEDGKKKSCICAPPEPTCTCSPPQPTCTCALPEPTCTCIPSKPICTCGSPKPTCICTSGEGEKVEEDEKVEGQSDCEAELADVNEKLNNAQAQLSEAEKEKGNALKAMNELKKTYDKLMATSTKDAALLEKLKKEKAELAQQFEAQQIKLKQAEENCKQALEREKEALANQVGKIEANALQSTKQVRRSGDQLASAVKNRDEHIRRLSGTTERLADSIKQKEEENRKLLEEQKIALQNLMDAQSANKDLADTNAGLIKNIQDFKDKILRQKECVRKTLKEIAECKEEAQKLRDEVSTLKERLKLALRGPKELRKLAKLEEKLRESREREQKWLNEAVMIENKLKELQDSQDSAGAKFDDERDRLEVELRKAQDKYELTYKELQTTKADNMRRVETMKEEFERFSQEMFKKEEMLIQSKNELQADFDQLVEDAQRDRKALEDLIARTKFQDTVVKTQHDALVARDERIALAYAENRALKQQALEMHNRIVSLNGSLDESIIASQELQEEMKSLQSQLEEARDQIIVKDKRISQQSSQLEELNSAVLDYQNKLQSLTEELEITSEKLKKLEQEAINNLGGELGLLDGADRANRIANLLDELCKCTRSGGDALTMKLEEKKELLEQESALQIQLAIRQKDKAMEAAKYATNKLLETVTDFNDQLEIHKRVQYMLAKMLQEKEDQIKTLKHCTPKPNKSNTRFCGNPKCKFA